MDRDRPDMVDALSDLYWWLEGHVGAGGHLFDADHIAAIRWATTVRRELAARDPAAPLSAEVLLGRS